MALTGNFLDRVMQGTATTGTGTMTLGSAVLPYRTFADAGAVNATAYWYLIEDGSTAWEVGYGTYTAAGPTLTRNLIASSSGSLLNLSGTATVACNAPARSMGFLGARVKKAADETTANYTTATAVVWDAEVFDVGGWHDNVTNNTRLTLPAGYGINYIELTASVAVGGNTETADRWSAIHITRNTETWPSILVGYNDIEHGGVNPYMTVTSGPISVSAGDYFQCFFQTESDASITVLEYPSFFAVKVLG